MKICQRLKLHTESHWIQRKYSKEDQRPFPGCTTAEFSFHMQRVFRGLSLTAEFIFSFSVHLVWLSLFWKLLVRMKQGSNLKRKAVFAELAGSEENVFFMHETNAGSCFKKGWSFDRNLSVQEYSHCWELNIFDEYGVQCGAQMTEQALRKYKTKQKILTLGQWD